MEPTCDTSVCGVCKKLCTTFTILGEMDYYCGETCMAKANDTRSLGCHLSDLHPGMEFSQDEGRTWVTVRTEPRYVDVDGDRLTMTLQASTDASLGSWETVTGEDSDRVILHREWKG